MFYDYFPAEIFTSFNHGKTSKQRKGQKSPIEYEKGEGVIGKRAMKLEHHKSNFS